MKFGGLALVWAGVIAVSAALEAPAAAMHAASQRNSSAQFARFPITFEKNTGQAGGAVDFVSRGKGFSFGITATRAVMLLGRKASAVEMHLRGGRAEAGGEGMNVAASRSNYFLGKDSSRWRTNVTNFGKVRYGSVYPGIDVVYHGTNHALEYDFVVAPHADARRVAIDFRGAASRIDENGDLVLQLADGELRQHKPVAYQEIAGIRRAVSARYQRTGRNQYGFALGRYDHEQPLVIDPSLGYSTYLGGSGSDTIAGMAVDAAGNVYVAGSTPSTDFPSAGTPYQRTYAGGSNDVYVAKLNASGTGLVYSTYVGSTDSDSASAIAVDSAGNAYVAGNTNSNNFPVTAGAYRTTYVGPSDAFLFKLNSTGSALTFSTHFASASVRGIAITAGSEVYLAGTTAYSTFPTTAGAYKTSVSNSYFNHGFVSLLNSTGSSLIASTFLAGSNGDSLNALALDSAGHPVVVGTTSSNDFPTTPGAYRRSFTPYYTDAFVTIFATNLQSLVASTFLGGSSSDSGLSVAVDSSSVYIAGSTQSSDFPFASPSGSYYTDYVAKLPTTLAALNYATVVNSNSYNSCSDLCGPFVAVDSAGSAYATGRAASSFTSTNGALQPLTSGGMDIYLVRVNSAGTANYATTLGGNFDDYPQRIIVDASNRAYIAGTTGSTSFPTTPGALQRRNATPTTSYSYGSNELFIARVDMDGTSCSVSAGPGTANVGAGYGGTTFNITAPAGCPWSASVGDTSWLSIGIAGGVGSDTLTVAYAPNNNTSSRQSTVSISGQSLTIRQAGAACTYTLSAIAADFPAFGGLNDIYVNTPSGCNWTATSNVPWITITSTNSSYYTFPSARYLVLSNTGVARTGTITIAGQTYTVTQQAGGSGGGGGTTNGLRFVPVAPCRIADTRNANGPFGGPFLSVGTSRDFAVQNSGCGIPGTAQAYSLNVTAVPRGGLSYLTVWPTGTAQPTSSTLNSLDGRIKANAAIVPAGTGGSVSVYAQGNTDVVLDVNGYFLPGTQGEGYAYYSLPPCRLADSRTPVAGSGITAPLGGSAVALNVLATGCNVPSNATAYAVNFTAVPRGSLLFLTTWPWGNSRPTVSTLNALEGKITANAAIVPAGTNGSIALYAEGATDVVVDINGYFAPATGVDALALYTVTPCRSVDTRLTQWSPALSGSRTFAIAGSTCSVPSTAKAFSLNATVVPRGGLGYLTLYPAGTTRPNVSTLNALDGSITSNAAFVPTTNGSISAYSTETTDLVLDIAGYFAP